VKVYNIICRKRFKLCYGECRKKNGVIGDKTVKSPTFPRTNNTHQNKNITTFSIKKEGDWEEHDKDPFPHRFFLGVGR
jgi:hypothetical protein